MLEKTAGHVKKKKRFFLGVSKLTEKYFGKIIIGKKHNFFTNTKIFDENHFGDGFPVPSPQEYHETMPI